MEATSFIVTSDLVKPVMDTIMSSLSVLVPIGLTIMSTFIGIGLIQRVIYKFL